MTDQDTEICVDTTRYLINHIFLPPKLPGEDDYEPKHEESLLELLSDALSVYKSHIPVDQDDAVNSIISMIDRTKEVCDSHGHVTDSKLKSALHEFCEQGESSSTSRIVKFY